MQQSNRLLETSKTDYSVSPGQKKNYCKLITFFLTLLSISVFKLWSAFMSLDKTNICNGMSKAFY